MADDPREVGETILRQMEEGWNAGDGAAFAAPFTEDADFVAIRGDHHHGRQAIAEGHQHIFSTFYRGSRVRYELTRARRLTDDVCLVHNAATLDAPPAAGPMAGIHHATSTLVIVRTADGWKVAAFHNTMVTE
jgi:uncharacterized protein (TIGR02246 family)